MARWFRLGLRNHPFQAVTTLGSTLAAVFPRFVNVGFPAIPGEPSRSTPKHAFSGRNNDSLKGMVRLILRSPVIGCLQSPCTIPGFELLDSFACYITWCGWQMVVALKHCNYFLPR